MQRVCERLNQLLFKLILPLLHLGDSKLPRHTAKDPLARKPDQAVYINK